MEVRESGSSQKVQILCTGSPNRFGLFGLLQLGTIVGIVTAPRQGQALHTIQDDIYVGVDRCFAESLVESYSCLGSFVTFPVLLTHLNNSIVHPLLPRKTKLHCLHTTGPIIYKILIFDTFSLSASFRYRIFRIHQTFTNSRTSNQKDESHNVILVDRELLSGSNDTNATCHITRYDWPFSDGHV